MVRFLLVVLLFSASLLHAQQQIAVETFQISQSTLNHLQREGLPESLLGNLIPLTGKEFGSREVFTQVLRELPIPPEEPEELELILRYSGQERLKIEAEEFLSNLSEGEAIFRGNVRGRVARENLDFHMAKLRVLRQAGAKQERLIGEGGVEFKQWERLARMDYVTYERGLTPGSTSEGRKFRMEGNVLIEAEQGSLSAHLVNADLSRQIVVLEGQNSAQGRIRLEVRPDLLETEPQLRAPGEPPSLLLQAYRAELNGEERRAIFEGDVEMERQPQGVYVRSGRIEIRFNERQQINSAQAERGVCIEQPGRLARADQAYFNDIAQTIRLEGTAEVYSGSYILKGNSITLFLDVNRGVAQGDEMAPIEVTIAMENQPQPFQCR